MIHNTYRRLDDSSLKLGPLSLGQWLVIALIAGLMVALKELTGIGMQAILCISTVAVAGPFAAMALSEGGRPSYLRQIRDALRWVLSPKVYMTGGGTPRPYTLKLEHTHTKKARRSKRHALPVDDLPSIDVGADAEAGLDEEWSA